jgi:pyruvate dehydrogenase E2 component (dihydrolipoamide acetyltransferase)
MAVDVVMPQMGESIFEGTVTKWLKKPGDQVARDEPLFEISTDKVDAEIPAPVAGVLKEIKVSEGQTVPVQTVVAVIEADGSASAPETPAKAPAGQATPAPPGAAGPARADAPPQRVERSGESGAEKAAEPHSSPLVRRLAEENKIDLATVRGTGAGGRVSKQDILAAMAARESSSAKGAPPPAAGPAGTLHAPGALEPAVPRERVYFGRYRVEAMSVMRQRIAEHMVASKRVSPHVYSVDEADMTRIAQLRGAVHDEFLRRHGVKLTFLPFFVRACVEAVRAFPTVNASVDGTNIVLHEDVNIGIAVALDNGLIVPVLRNAEEKSFLGIQRGINDLAERARTKKLNPDEVQQSTFSITNPGIFGGLLGLPVINQPNVAILAIGAIQKRPVVVDDAIAIRSMVYLTLSYDHRVVDGAVGHQFMQRVKQHLENWNEEIL